MSPNWSCAIGSGRAPPSAATMSGTVLLWPMISAGFGDLTISAIRPGVFQRRGGLAGPLRVADEDHRWRFAGKPIGEQRRLALSLRRQVRVAPALRRVEMSHHIEIRAWLRHRRQHARRHEQQHQRQDQAEDGHGGLLAV
jgi:hypothetical protein